MRTDSGSAAAISAGIAGSVSGARQADLDAFTEACRQLTWLDAQNVGIIEAAVIRSLLEEIHPEGLAAEDVRELLVSCTTTFAWYPGLDASQLLLVLSGALGMADPDEQPATDRDLLAGHAALIITQLSAAAPAELSAHIDRAVREIHRAQTVEMP